MENDDNNTENKNQVSINETTSNYDMTKSYQMNIF